MVRQRLWGRWAPDLARLWLRLPLRLRRAIVWRTTPKFLVGVTGVCLNDDNQALVVQHRFHPRSIEWGLPGGWLQRGEAPAVALRRELREETGLEVEIVEPVLTDGDGEWVEVIYLCRANGNPRHLQSEELRDWRWCDPATVELPLPARHRRALRLVGERVRV